VKILKAFISRLILATLRVDVKYRSETLTALAAGGCIVTCNHVSLLDGLIVALASPVPLAFAVDTDFSRRTQWSRRGLAALVMLGYGKVVPLDGSAPYGMRTLARRLVVGENVTVFPEGVISLTGKRAEDRPGLSWLVKRTQARVVELKIAGAEQSRWFAKSGTAFWPKIYLTF
jgi:acyl-[acyl-carrier-protein]-phospholipid O-acyltransferase/long-chain-fatty-acid--[acyl-carrier-protein] ligase